MITAALGIDLGTSSVKCVLVGQDGRVLATGQERYAVERPHAGWAEQDPAAWWTATTRCIRGVLADLPGVEVATIGLAGQMHGLVLLDAAGLPVRPAIIWSDTRSADEVAVWRDLVGDETAAAVTGMPIATGMLGVSLLWVRRHEPEVWARARYAVLPKDQLRQRLTGVLATEPSDAGGSLLFDLDGNRPAAAILGALDLPLDILPEIVPTLSLAGALTADAASATGLPAGIPVAAGGADQVMGALALGIDSPRRAAVAISSGGTAFAGTRRSVAANTGLHVLAGPRPGERLAMGVVLAAGLATDWLVERLFGGSGPETVAAALDQAAGIPAGADGLLASPHLGGTRTPVVDDRPRGAFLGLGFQHTPAHLLRATVDGICVALAESVHAMADPDEPMEEIVISGGGARFDVWRHALADATGLPVVTSTDLEHSAIGAALAGAHAGGVAIDFDARARVGGRIEPDAANRARYSEIAERLRALDALFSTEKGAQP